MTTSLQEKKTTKTIIDESVRNVIVHILILQQ